MPEKIERPLTREEVKSVIEGHSSTTRIPALIHFWVHPDAFKDPAAASEILKRYPMDAQTIPFNIPGIFTAPEDDPAYRWINLDDITPKKHVGEDAQLALEDWNRIDRVLNNFPKPDYPGLLQGQEPPDGRYRLGFWWYCLFERHWSLRGMTNALTDYYTDPDNVKKLFRGLTDFYLTIIERGKKEAGLDGILISDDIGHQTGPMFSLEMFREFFKPFYREIIDKAHSLGMHLWLHACGNIELFMPDLIEIGLDVIHPIQKYAMAETKTAERFGKDICIWTGLDVQQIIPWGTPGDVRKEVRYLIDTYYRSEGKLMITAGNGINGDCPPENLEAFLDETIRYGSAKVKKK